MPFGTGLADVLAACGFATDGPTLVGGYHGTWLTPEQVSGHLVSHADLARSQATLGAGVVLPTTAGACPVQLTSQVVAYLAGERAGRCGPCTNGLPALADACAALAAGHASERTWTVSTSWSACCPGAAPAHTRTATVRLVRSLLRAFPAEVATT